MFFIALDKNGMQIVSSQQQQKKKKKKKKERKKEKQDMVVMCLVKLIENFTFKNSKFSDKKV